MRMSKQEVEARIDNFMEKKQARFPELAKPLPDLYKEIVLDIE